MIHNLTAGHFDSGDNVAKPLDMSVVVKLLPEPSKKLGVSSFCLRK